MSKDTDKPEGMTDLDIEAEVMPMFQATIDAQADILGLECMECEATLRDSYRAMVTSFLAAAWHLTRHVKNAEALERTMSRAVENFEDQCRLMLRDREEGRRPHGHETVN